MSHDWILYLTSPAFKGIFNLFQRPASFLTLTYGISSFSSRVRKHGLHRNAPTATPNGFHHLPGQHVRCGSELSFSGDRLP
jgi:hypothetical protein